MKQILFIGSRKKYLPFVRYCQERGYRFLIFEAVPNLENACPKLSRITQYNGYENFFKLDYYITYLEKNEFKPNIIINQKDQNNWLELEHKLLSHFKCDNYFDYKTLEFFSFKSQQDKICKKLFIPTIPLFLKKERGGVIVKKDAGFSGGSGFKRETSALYQAQENEFIQSEISIDYTIGVHIYIDQNQNWYILNYHQLKYLDNCPIESQSPYFPIKQEESIISESITKLSKELNVRQRLVFWQFVKSRDGVFYNMDFNCRVSGGYDAGSYDTDISNANWPKILIEDRPIEKVIFGNQIRCLYKKKQLFGYSDYNRYKEPIESKELITRIT